MIKFAARVNVKVGCGRGTISTGEGDNLGWLVVSDVTNHIAQPN